MSVEIASFEHVYKFANNIFALQDFNLSIAQGEIVGVLGANEAAAEAVIQAAGGLTNADKGSVYINGRLMVRRQKDEPVLDDVLIIRDVPGLVAGLTLAENLYLSSSLKQCFTYFDTRRINSSCAALLAHYGIDAPVNRPVSRFPADQYIIFELLKAAALNKRLIIINERLGCQDSATWMLIRNLILRMRTEGYSFLIFGSQYKILADLADRIAVFRHTMIIKFAARRQFDDRRFMDFLEGLNGTAKRARDYTSEYIQEPYSPDNGSVRINIRHGAITGVFDTAGLLTSREEADGDFPYKNLFDYICLDGRPLRIASYLDAEHESVGIIPRDYNQAVIGDWNFIDNIMLFSRSKFGPFFYASDRLHNYMKKEYARKLDIPDEELDTPVSKLNNIQLLRIYLSRWDFVKLECLFCPGPFDSASPKAREILIDFFCDQSRKGVAVFLYGSRFKDLASCCDRIVTIS